MKVKAEENNIKAMKEANEVQRLEQLFFESCEQVRIFIFIFY